MAFVQNPIRCLLFLLCALLPAYCVTTASDVRKALDGVASYRQQEPMATSFSPEFAERLQLLRRRARDFAFGSVVEAARNASGRDGVLELARRRTLRAGLPLRADAEWMAEQFTPSVRIQYFPLAESSAWIGARIHVGIPCGEDISLYLWKLNDSDDGSGVAPELVFARESSLTDLAGSMGSLHMAMTVDPASGKPQLATIETGVWCNSQWRKALLQVMRRGDHPYRGERLFTHSEMAFLGAETPPEVAVTEGGFRFQFQGQFWLDPSQPSRPKRVDIQVSGDRAEMLVPRDEDPASFLDQWLSQPWSRSRAWTTGHNLNALRSWHDSLSPESPDPVRLEVVNHGGCGGDPQMYFVHLHAALPASALSSGAQEVYGILRRQERGFRVDDIAPKLPAGCAATSQAN